MLVSINSATAVHLIKQLHTIHRTQLTGSLGIQNEDGIRREICFHLGRLVWVSSTNNRASRWWRCMSQACPHADNNIIQTTPKKNVNHWEYLALKALIQRKKITRAEAVLVIENFSKEVLFDILQDALHGELKYQFIREDLWNSPIGVLNLESFLNEVDTMLSHWCDLGLAHQSPNLAPFIKQHDELQRSLTPAIYQAMADTLDGNVSIRDLAVQKNKDLLFTARLLLPYIKRDLIGLKKIVDLEVLETPVKPRTQALSQTILKKVVCIDDSLHICNLVGSILTQAGYQYTSVQDSVQALPALLEHRPDLILLDLVMPVANGYEICSQIRRISTFKQTPIVILTG
ncbi:MAG TPA: response regulator, partial [Chroococcidiopsis sp.]